MRPLLRFVGGWQLIHPKEIREGDEVRRLILLADSSLREQFPVIGFNCDLVSGGGRVIITQNKSALNGSVLNVQDAEAKWPGVSHMMEELKSRLGELKTAVDLE